MVNEAKAQNSTFYTDVKSLTEIAMKDNEAKEPGAVYLEHLAKLLEGSLDEKVYWEVRGGWKEDDGKEFQGIETIALASADEWGFEKTLKFIKAWDLLIPISPSFLDRPDFKKDGELRADLRESLSSAQFAYTTFGKAITLKSVPLAFSQITFAQRKGHYLLSALMCKKLLDLDLLKSLPEKEKDLAKIMAKSLGALTSWFTYNRYTSAAMVESTPLGYEEDLLPEA